MNSRLARALSWSSALGQPRDVQEPADQAWGAQLMKGSMCELKRRGHTRGMAVSIVGLGLHSYYGRELLACLALFCLAFSFLALLALGGLLAWSASEQVMIRTEILSRNAVAFSQRLIAAYASSRTARKFRDRTTGCPDGSRPPCPSRLGSWSVESKPMIGLVVWDRGFQDSSAESSE